jgi:hypothetical protein
MDYMKMNVLLPSVIVLGSLFLSCSDGIKRDTAVVAVPTATTVAVGDSAFKLTFAGLEAIIDYKNGGRLESFALNGENCLSGKTVNAGNWGTSMWPSPQSAWGWPPSQQLDNMAYEVLQDSSEIILKSLRDPKQGFVFTKAYKINTVDTSLIVTYTILNDTNVAQKVAAWEISRVAPGGLTFYPRGDEAKRGALASLTKDSIGVTWFQYEAATIPSGVPKLLADGKEGWLAQVSNGLLFVKSFEDVATGKYAPEEGEIELYANPDHSYIEIEQQGTYVELKAGEELNYQVRYKLVKLPASIHVNTGSYELLNAARSALK